MKKTNERNAGRKKVPNGVRVTCTVPKDRVKDFKEFVKPFLKCSE